MSAFGGVRWPAADSGAGGCDGCDRTVHWMLFGSPRRTEFRIARTWTRRTNGSMDALIPPEITLRVPLPRFGCCVCYAVMLVSLSALAGPMPPSVNEQQCDTASSRLIRVSASEDSLRAERIRRERIHQESLHQEALREERLREERLREERLRQERLQAERSEDERLRQKRLHKRRLRPPDCQSDQQTAPEDYCSTPQRQ